jgi:hypothetical protein
MHWGQRDRHDRPWRSSFAIELVDVLCNDRDLAPRPISPLDIELEPRS